jgi:hypothetical protein
MDWSGIQESSNKKGIITSILIVDVRRAFFFFEKLEQAKNSSGLENVISVLSQFAFIPYYISIMYINWMRAVQSATSQDQFNIFLHCLLQYFYMI